MGLLLIPIPTGGCGDELQGGALLPALRLDTIGPSPLVPGTRLTLTGSGFVVEEVARLAVIFRGDVAGEAVQFAVQPQRVDDQTLVVSVSGEVELALIRDSGTFTGSVSVLRTPLVDADPEEVSRRTSLDVARQLTPTLTGIEPPEVWIGEQITLSGDGFLHPSEGASLVELSGTMTTFLPPRTLEVPVLQIPAVPPSAGRRDALTFTLTPDVMGILPGRFDGTVSVVNASAAGATTRSGSLPAAALTLQDPVITEMAPLRASRGQWITFRGHGFSRADGLLQVATVLQLDGTFTTDDGDVQDLTGPRAVTLVPDLVEGNAFMGAVLRVDKDTNGRLSGLGLLPGTFSGTVAPLLLFGPDSTRGLGLPVTFEVLPQKQVVYLKLLPGFDRALAEFGLLAQREAVKARILEVCARDYAGVHIAFSFEPPTDFAEYSIVEIAGRDPNGTGLFGLDNTAGKDVGNVRFDDIIGGFNADTESDGYAAYGGIFPAEFLNLSPTLADNPLGSPRFDDVFASVAPALGGTPAAEGEASEPGVRGGAVREAVRVFGNLVGSTISHEVGHSLGLSAVDGQFHNIGDNPGWLMDSGSNRPFEERAELDGAGPS
ncbi:MAG: hypothetical protein CSA66_02130, partial [Proteobacteria bacterium]